MPSPTLRSWPPPFGSWGSSSPSPSAAGRAGGSWWPGSAGFGPPVWPAWRRSPVCPSRPTDRSSSLLALVENLQRRDLDFWEEAAALRKLIDTYHISQEEAARRIGKSPSAVANKLRLLKLSPDVLSLLRDGGATERHARALLRLDAPEQQLEGARQVVNQGLTVAQTEVLVDGMLSSKAHPARRRPVFVIKDVRLFLNTITRSLDVMRSAGVDAQCSRQDSEDAITLTIHIPRRAG